MRVLLKGTGVVLYVGAGLVMFLSFMSFLGDWLGFFGYVLGLIFSPGIIIFPAIVWIKTGVFPSGYFLIWAIGLVGGSVFFWLGSIGEKK